MGLQRPPEQFERMYSPPEPPAPARSPRALVVLAGVVAFVLIAGGVYLLLPGADERGTATGAVMSGDREASVGDTGHDRPQGTIRTLPPPCGTVATATVRSLIPRARRQESSNQTLTTCTYSSDGDQFRWLRVEARLFSRANTDAPEEDAGRYFETQWTQARDATLERTVSLARHQSLGDEAYRWFKQDRGQPAAVGQVVVRAGNVVVAVGYSERVGGRTGLEARENACLDTATSVAREVLRGLR